MGYGGRGGGGGRGGSKDYDNNLRGALFENDRKEKDGDPDMRGQCEIDGVEYWVAAWWKNSNKTGDYLSLAFTLKDERGSQRNDQRRAPYGQGNRPGNSRGPGARVNPGRRGPNSDQRDDRGGNQNNDRHPNAPSDEMDDDIPF